VPRGHADSSAAEERAIAAPHCAKNLGARARIPLGNKLFYDLNRPLDLLVGHRLNAAGMLEFQLFRDEHGADLQVARRALPPNPLEHLAPMLLPVLRQIEQKALVERSPRGLR
jgi:hypothetical protein